MKVHIKKLGGSRFDVRIERTRIEEKWGARAKNLTREALSAWVAAEVARMLPEPLPQGR